MLSFIYGLKKQKQKKKWHVTAAAVIIKKKKKRKCGKDHLGIHLSDHKSLTSADGVVGARMGEQQQR